MPSGGSRVPSSFLSPEIRIGDVVIRGIFSTELSYGGKYMIERIGWPTPGAGGRETRILREEEEDEDDEE